MFVGEETLFIGCHCRELKRKFGICVVVVGRYKLWWEQKMEKATSRSEGGKVGIFVRSVEILRFFAKPLFFNLNKINVSHTTHFWQKSAKNHSMDI